MRGPKYTIWDEFGNILEMFETESELDACIDEREYSVIDRLHDGKDVNVLVVRDF